MTRREFLDCTLGGLLMAASPWSPLAAEQDENQLKHLGRMFNFWRNSAVLGPFLEQGEGLTQIPDYLLTSDFPYRKRPYSKEVPFADHLSVVRLLGGYDGDPTGTKDLAFRDGDGKIQYRMGLLKPRLQPYLDNGYDSLTLVLDNTPWCFPENPVAGSGLGQSAPPRNEGEWYKFIQVVCEELVQILGPDVAQNLRFRVGTEDDSEDRFSGSQSQFIWFYDATAAAVASVLPQAKVGAFNISDPTVLGVEKYDHVRALPLAEHCIFQPNLFDKSKRTRFDWVAFSKYFRPGDDPEADVIPCRDVWALFGRKVPPLIGVSREIHEFGIAPFGEKGVFVSAEPGALGAALTCQIMLGLRESGIHRLWHWNVDMFDEFRDRQNQLLQLSTSEAWLLSVLERMIGGEYFVFPTPQNPNSTQYKIVGSVKEKESIFLVSAYNTNIGQSREEMVQFHVPNNLVRKQRHSVQMVCLSKKTAVHDRIRLDLQRAGLLNPDFVSLPARLGTILEMGGPAAGVFVGDRWNAYTEQWSESLTLKPFTPNLGTIFEDGSGITFNLHIVAPMIVVLVMQPAI